MLYTMRGKIGGVGDGGHVAEDAFLRRLRVIRGHRHHGVTADLGRTLGDSSIDSRVS